jgi:hypothetical protein
MRIGKAKRGSKKAESAKPIGLILCPVIVSGYLTTQGELI